MSIFFFVSKEWKDEQHKYINLFKDKEYKRIITIVLDDKLKSHMKI